MVKSTAVLGRVVGHFGVRAFKVAHSVFRRARTAARADSTVRVHDGVENTCQCDREVKAKLGGKDMI